MQADDDSNQLARTLQGGRFLASQYGVLRRAGVRLAGAGLVQQSLRGCSI